MTKKEARKAIAVLKQHSTDPTARREIERLEKMFEPKAKGPKLTAYSRSLVDNFRKAVEMFMAAHSRDNVTSADTDAVDKAEKALLDRLLKLEKDAGKIGPRKKK